MDGQALQPMIIATIDKAPPCPARGDESLILPFRWCRLRCVQAVAHASLNLNLINRDNTSDRRHINLGLPIVRAFRARTIEHHLGVKSGATIRREREQGTI